MHSGVLIRMLSIIAHSPSCAGVDSMSVSESDLVHFRNLSLVALVRPNAMEQHSSVIDYNVAVLRDAALEIFGLGMRAGGR